MAINDWWGADPAQRYWLETTGRTNIGADLLAPQEDDGGSRENPGYVLVTYVANDDIVLHYDTNARAIVAWSIAEGGYWEDESTWASVPGGGDPYARPHWVHGLRGPYLLADPITLQELRAVGPQIGDVHDRLAAVHSGPLYFPFTKFAKSWAELRPTQRYITKWPTELIQVIPRLGDQLEEVPRPGELDGGSGATNAKDPDLGRHYIDVYEDPSVTPADPYAVDPSVIERGLKGHAATQNALAEEVRHRGHVPLRPGPRDPAFDLAWKAGDALFVAEVKSLTAGNQNSQLRLGLGQVLWYRHLFGQRYDTVVAVLATESCPADPAWIDLLTDLGVRLVWPGNYSALDAP